MKNDKIFWSIILFLIVLLPNIIFYILKQYFAYERPLIIYDYFFIIILIGLRAPSIITWFIYLILISFELILITSKVYFFKLDIFIRNLTYIKYYNFSYHQIAVSFCLIFSITFIFFILKKIKNMNVINLKIIKISALFLVLTFFFDVLNGSSDIVNVSFFRKFSRNNIASLNSRTVYLSLSNLYAKANKPIINQKGQSITYDYFSNDSTNNQMLIMIESFGQIQDSIKRGRYQQSISSIFKQNNWNTLWGESYFNGSTTNGELRELLNCNGDYRFFNSINNQNKINSIFDIKKNQGYQIKAIHSYKGGMFERNLWWKNIGIDSAFFLEDFIKNNLYLNYENSFTSLFDEEAFDAIQNKIKIGDKQFTYFLTVNSHLPFLGNPKIPIISKLFNIDSEINISEEAKNQNKRISNLLEHIAKNLNGHKIDKILIIGDHAPPFIDKSDKAFYSNKLVPYLLVYKKETPIYPTRL